MRTKPLPVAADEIDIERYETLLVRGVLIPDAEPGKKPLFGIIPGQYDRGGIVALLRYHKRNPDAVQFIADMME